MNTISRLASWKRWRELSGFLRKEYNYFFPERYYIWVGKTGPTCPICNDVRSFVDASNNQQYYCICETLQWADQHELYWGNYEAPVKNAWLKDLKPFTTSGDLTGATDLKKYLEHLEVWMEKLDRWMFVQGGVGTGKTTSFRAIKTQLPALTVYISVDRFQRYLFKALQERTVENLIHTLSIAPILVLDDWGLEHDSEFTTNAFAGIINTRYLNGPENFLTLVSTNLRIEELLNSPSLSIQRIASRMVDTQISDVFRLRQEDFRSPVTQKKIRFVK